MVSDDVVAGGSGGSEKRHELRIRRKTDNVQLHELPVTVFPSVQVDFGTLYFKSLGKTSWQSYYPHAENVSHSQNWNFYLFVYYLNENHMENRLSVLVFFFLTKSVLPSAAPSRAASIESISDDWLHSAKIDLSTQFH